MTIEEIVERVKREHGFMVLDARIGALVRDAAKAVVEECAQTSETFCEGYGSFQEQLAHEIADEIRALAAPVAAKPIDAETLKEWAECDDYDHAHPDFSLGNFGRLAHELLAAREALNGVHDALGEDRNSEDSNLGECVGELKEGIAELQRRIAVVTRERDEWKRRHEIRSQAWADAVRERDELQKRLDGLDQHRLDRATLEARVAKLEAALTALEKNK